MSSLREKKTKDKVCLFLEKRVYSPMLLYQPEIIQCQHMNEKWAAVHNFANHSSIPIPPSNKHILNHLLYNKNNDTREWCEDKIR